MMRRTLVRTRFWFIIVSLGATTLLAVPFDEAAAFNYRYIGDHTAGYNRRMNGGPGCVMGDCSRSKQLRNYARKHGAIVDPKKR